MNLETTATFIGHNDCYGVSEERVKSAITKLIESGVTDFLNGGQGGFDRICARCVYELKKDYPHIKNHLGAAKSYEIAKKKLKIINLGEKEDK